MVKQFQFAYTPSLIFGIGGIQKLPKLVHQFGANVLFVTGRNTEKNISSFARTLEQSIASGSNVHIMKIENEPAPNDIDNAVSVFKDKDIKVVVSIGGGSVIDAGKAISAMLVSEGEVKDYLEGVGTKNPSGTKLPFIALPTTSGTGSEATKNAVITQLGSNGFKKSLRHDNYVPDFALIDPELTVSCPANITASSSMDAFTQLLESYLSSKANPMTDALAFDAIRLIYGSLEAAYADGANLEARSDISYAAYISGVTLANAGLGLVHGFAQPLGSFFKVPHGLVCGTLMAATNKITVQELEIQGEVQSEAYKKYVKIGKMFARSHSKSDNYYANYMVSELERLTDELNLEKLSKFNVSEQDFQKIVLNTGLKNHPIKLDDEKIMQILKERL